MRRRSLTMQTFLENWARHCAQEFERLRLFQFPVIWRTLAKSKCSGAGRVVWNSGCFSSKPVPVKRRSGSRAPEYTPTVSLLHVILRKNPLPSARPIPEPTTPGAAGCDAVATTKPSGNCACTLKCAFSPRRLNRVPFTLAIEFCHDDNLPLLWFRAGHGVNGTMSSPPFSRHSPDDPEIG
jgi:hypothetical protein